MTPLQRTLSEGRLTHGAWTRTAADGRQLLCLLAAMSPEVAEVGHADACPAHVAPLWLAHLLPWLDDHGTNAARPTVWARVADLQARWAALWPRGWPEGVSRRADARVRRAAVVAARPYATERQHPAIDSVVALLDRCIAGDEPTRDEWEAAEAEATVVRAEATVVRAAAAWSSASAWSACSAAAPAWSAQAAWSASAWAAQAAADAASEAARDAANAVDAAAGAAAKAAEEAEEAEAADALTVQILDIIENEIKRGAHRREEER